LLFKDKPRKTGVASKRAVVLGKGQAELSLDAAAGHVFHEQDLIDFAAEVGLGVDRDGPPQVLQALFEIARVNVKRAQIGGRFLQAGAQGFLFQDRLDGLVLLARFVEGDGQVIVQSQVVGRLGNPPLAILDSQ
jgi:hypothetical protein